MLPHCFSNCSPHPIDRKLFKFEHFTSFGEFSSHFGIQLWINSWIYQHGNSRKNQRDMCIFCWNFSLVPSNAFIHQMDRWINFLELMKNILKYLQKNENQQTTRKLASRSLLVLNEFVKYSPFLGQAASLIRFLISSI